MAKDNTLGAPTEGLGQTVTFGAPQQNGVPQTPTGQRGTFRTASTGGTAFSNTRGTFIPTPRDTSTFDLLMKLGEKIIRPHVEAAKSVQYLEGMQRVAQGEAVAEIVDEQPWYGQLFGNTSLVDGARAFSANAAAVSISVDLESNMDQLRKLGPKEFAAHTNNQLLGAKTGDAVADAMMGQQILSTLPAVMKGQAKAHFRYQQEMYEQSYGDSVESSMALLGANDAQSRIPGSTKDSNDVLGAAIPLLDAMSIPDGQDPKRYNAIIANKAEKAIALGNFAVFDVLNASKRLGAFSPADQQSLVTARNHASAAARTKLSSDFQIKLADWSVMPTVPGTTDEAIIKRAQELDAEYTQMTGDTMPLVGGAKTVNELIQLRNVEAQRLSQLATQERTATTAAAKVLAKQELTRGIAAMVVSGAVPGEREYYMGRDAKTKEQQQEVFDHIRAVTDPKSYLTVLARQASYGFIDDVVKDQLQSATLLAVNGSDPALFNKAYQERYLPLVQASGGLKEVVAQEYAGKSKEVLARYHQLAQGRPVSPTDAAVYFTDAVQPKPKALTDSKRDKALLEEVTTGNIMTLLGNTFLHDAAAVVYPRELLGLLKHNLPEYLPPDQAVEAAKRAMPTLSIVGGYHWMRNDRDTKLGDWFEKNREVGGVAQDNINRATRHSFDKYADESGISGSVQVGQISDTADGQPRLFVMGQDDNGQVQVKTFTAKDVNANWQKKNTGVTPAAKANGPAAPFSFGM